MFGVVIAACVAASCILSVDSHEYLTSDLCNARIKVLKHEFDSPPGTFTMYECKDVRDLPDLPDTQDSPEESERHKS